MRLTPIILRTLLAWALVAVTLVGCHSTADEYVDAHPNLDPEVRRAILDGRVILGMSPDEVRAAWGEPDYISTALGSDGSVLTLNMRYNNPPEPGTPRIAQDDDSEVRRNESSLRILRFEDNRISAIETH